MQLTEIQKLQQILNQIVFPESSDRLKFGCEILDTECDEKYTIGIDAEYVDSILRIAGYDFHTHAFHILGFPITLDLIRAALEKKGMFVSFWSDSKTLCIYNNSGMSQIDVLYRPSKPMQESTVKTLLEVLK